MEKENKKQAIITSICLFILTVALTSGACFLYRKPLGELIRITVFTALFSVTFSMIFAFEFIKSFLDHDNKEHPHRFLLVYSIGLILSLLFPLIDRGGWLFVGISVALLIFSDPVCSIFSVSGLIMISTILSSNGDVYTFMVYFLSSVIAIVVFRCVDETVKVGLSIFLAVSSLFVLETAGFVLLENEVLSAEQFIYPIVNIVVNSILIFVSLKYFNEKIVNRYRNKYQELNDQEYEALAKLKNISKEEYFRSIHTAYLTERIAGEIGCDVFAAKNLAYYHRIKKAFGYSLEELETFVKDNNFPPEAAKNLLEFSDKNYPIAKKEACIVYLSDKLISTLMVIFEKDNKTHLDYKELIDTLLEKPIINETLSKSDLSRKDFNTVKEIMKKEVLYYDFLR